MAPLLSGKNTLVTGGSRGLGRAICTAFAGEGARVAFTYSRDDEGAIATASACRTAGFDATRHKISVLDSAGLDALARSLEETWGSIDVLINNAGISQNLPLALMEEADWDLVMDTNVKGMFLASRAVLRGMIRRKAGVILNIGSLAGVRMIDAPVHYCASKAAVTGLTQALAKEVARHRIRVVCIAPGLLEDGVGRNLPENRLQDYLKHCSLGRVGTFEEVARFAAFVVSDACPYLTGETVLMAGGL